jgi:hypothetical protein
MPFLHLGPFLIPSAAKSFDDSLFTWIRIFLVRFLFRHAYVAWLDVLLSATVTLFRDSQFSRAPLFLKIFLFRHATVAWRDTFFCRRQATSAGIHNLLGSVPLALRVALQLASGPYAASSVL